MSVGKFKNNAGIAVQVAPISLRGMACSDPCQKIPEASSTVASWRDFQLWWLLVRRCGVMQRHSLQLPLSEFRELWYRRIVRAPKTYNTCLPPMFFLSPSTDHFASTVDGPCALPAAAHSLICTSFRFFASPRGDSVFAQLPSLHFVRTTVKRTTETTSGMRV